MKKPAVDKHTIPPRRVDFAGSFVKDWQRLSRSGRYQQLKEVMLLLVANRPEWRDHAL